MTKTVISQKRHILQRLFAMFVSLKFATFYKKNETARVWNAKYQFCKSLANDAAVGHFGKFVEHLCVIYALLTGDFQKSQFLF